jgi:hypothetical protein
MGGAGSRSWTSAVSTIGALCDTDRRGERDLVRVGKLRRPKAAASLTRYSCTTSIRARTASQPLRLRIGTKCGCPSTWQARSTRCRKKPCWSVTIGHG